MKTKHILPLATLLGALAAHAQGAFAFDSGSTGALGDLLVTNAVTVTLPPDGVLHYQRVEVTEEGSLTFVKNALNTPVTILARGEVIIAGSVVLDGATSSGRDPGQGGPGGFDGGRAATGGQPGGPGKGPGGGAPAADSNAGPGAFASRGDAGGGRAVTAGTVYGDPLLLPIIGGSGGGGRNDTFEGGGGGGGAILIASSSRISLPVAGRGIFARGGNAYYNDGSGGGVRLVAPVIDGIGIIDVRGGAEGGIGRIRFDTPNARAANLNLQGSFSIGSLMLTKLPVEPQLGIVQVGDRPIPQDAPGTVNVIFPTGTTAERVVRVQAKDFGSVVPIRVALTPDYGDRVIVDAELDNTAAGAVTKDITVTFPLNVVVAVNVWTR